MRLFLVCLGTLLLLHLAKVSSGQVVFNTMRYNDNFTWMASDSTWDWYGLVKHIPIRSSPSFLSLGGEVKYQYFLVSNGLWGYLPQDDDGYVLTKVLFHTDVHLTDNFRAFLQLQGNGANGKDPIYRGEVNPLDLHQGFVDYHWNVRQGTVVTLRAGRQELSYGAQRLISVHNLPNNRQAFDALKFMIDNRSMSIHFVYGYYVIPRFGNFDDSFSSNTKLYGLYNTFKLSDLNCDFYILGYNNRHSIYHAKTGEESRATVGARVHGTFKGWRFDTEGSYQHGNVETWRASAWMVSANVSYHWLNLKPKPAFGIRAEIISGDKSSVDSRINTFNPLFPRGSYYGLANVIGPSNIIDLHPSFELGTTSALFSLDYDLFWRTSKNDGLYSAVMTPLFEGKGSHFRFIAQQITAEVEWDPIPYFEFKIEYTYSDGGAFLEHIGLTKNIHFAAATFSLKF